MSEAAPIRVWDLPTRLFHWSLAALAVFSFVTGKVGGPWMEWHLRSGYAILALLIFRVAWGVAGSETSRFARFLAGPRAFVAHGRAILSGEHHPSLGHNPMGGWMIAFMLALMLAQASTGLFADDEIATQGPLAAKVSNAAVARLSTLHSWNAWLVLAAACVHVATIGVYQWVLKDDLVRPMFTGTRPARPGWEMPGPAQRGNVLAAALMACAAAIVYWLVVVYPR